MKRWRNAEPMIGKMRFTRWRGVLAALSIVGAGPLLAGSGDDIDRVLTLVEAPEGVVFEIVEADEGALQDRLPRVLDAIARIRARFPAIEFALVSHGREEFALQTRYQDEFPEIHQQVLSLVEDEVPVHVCETHAGWYDVSASDFPDYVNVAPTGPGQIGLYRELGYIVITLD